MAFATPPTFRKKGDISEVDTLLELARQQGGSLADAVQELTHPKTSILSTVGNTLKNSLMGFIDIISVPSQIIAGALSADLTVRDAIKNNVSPSEVIFGKF